MRVIRRRNFGYCPRFLWSGTVEWGLVEPKPAPASDGSQTAGSLPAPIYSTAVGVALFSHIHGLLLPTPMLSTMHLVVMTDIPLCCLEPGSKYSTSSSTGSRKPSGRRNSPTSSPTIAKQPLSSTAESTNTAPPRPGALRSQSYSKRHASFDTPREVPMPPMPFGSSSIDPIALDDGDMDRNDAAAAGWGNVPRQGMYQQSGSRQPETSRRPATDSPQTSRKPSAAVPPGTEHSKREGMRIELTDDMTSPPPQLARNNSAPTPPHTPSSERMDLRYPQNIDESTLDSAVSSVPSGSGSEQVSPAPDSAQVNPEKGGYMEAGEEGAIDGSEESLEAASPPVRGRMGVVFKEGRLSTSSLPLPRSYGAERVSRLPPPVRPTNRTDGNTSGSGSGSDGGQQAKTPTNFTETSSTYLEESDLMKTPSFTGNTHRTSYPLAGTFARDVPLVPGPRGSSLMAEVERNTQPGTAWRSSGPFMRRDYGEEDSEEKAAISSGQIPKQPEVEAPRAPLHPFLATPNLTPSASNQSLSFDTSSTTATQGRDLTSSPLISSSTLTVEGSSPATSADRTSTGSGSSGASSNLETFSDRLVSEPERNAPSVQPQPESRSATETSRNDSASQGSTASAVLRPSLTAEHSLGSVTQGPTMTVDTTPSAYILEASLPGYQRDEITLSTRKKRILHVVADGFVSGGGEF